jgi:hypothetical protein
MANKRRKKKVIIYNEPLFPITQELISNEELLAMLVDILFEGFYDLKKTENEQQKRVEPTKDC